MNDPVFEVVFPLGRARLGEKSLALRLTDLNNKTFCFLSDRLFRPEDIYPVIKEVLKKRYTGVRFVDGETFGNTHGPKEAEVISSMAEKLLQNKCDAVISGVGA